MFMSEDFQIQLSKPHFLLKDSICFSIDCTCCNLFLKALIFGNLAVKKISDHPFTNLVYCVSVNVAQFDFSFLPTTQQLKINPKEVVYIIC